MDEFDETGTWWLPGKDSERVVGSLQVTRGSAGPLLKLVGSFQGPPTTVGRRSFADYPIIYGHTSTGKMVTLDTARTVEAKSSGFLDPTISEDILARRAYVGAHLPLGPKTLCRQVRISFTHLDEWASAGERLIEPQSDAEHFAVRIPDPMPFDAFGTAASISYGRKESYSHQRFVLERPVAFLATPKGEMEIDAVYDTVVGPLQQFLSFACSADCQLTDLAFITDGVTYAVGDVTQPRWIETAGAGWPEFQVTSPHPWEMLLPLAGIRDRITDLLSGWSRLLARSPQVVDLLSAVTGGRPLPLEARFLFAVQAGEVYHRRADHFRQTDMDPQSHGQRVDAILNAFPDDKSLHKWIKWRLRWSNEPALSTRLEDLIAHAGLGTEALLREGYVKRATDTRNWLTHYDPRLEEAAAKGAEIYWLTEETIAIIELCLLRDLGFGTDEAATLFGKTRRARSLAEIRDANVVLPK